MSALLERVRGQLACPHCDSTDLVVGTAWRKGVTLDPFAGTGTTPIVADLHNRTGLGFDLDSRNADLVAARTVEVRRNLFGTIPELPGQQDLFDGAA